MILENKFMVTSRITVDNQELKISISLLNNREFNIEETLNLCSHLLAHTGESIETLIQNYKKILELYRKRPELK